jgi:ribosomal protein S18 acetylase RimI-like enzyme
MAGRILIRRMEINDLRRVFDIGNTVYKIESEADFYGRWNVNLLAESYELFPDICFVAARDKQLLGFAIGALDYKLKYGYILRLCINPAYERLNLEDLLYTEMIEKMSAMGMDVLMVDISADNKRAVDFYNGKGFLKEDNRIILKLNLKQE